MRGGVCGVQGGVAKRAGVKGTITEGVRAGGLRRLRYVGEEKTHLQHLATAGTKRTVKPLPVPVSAVIKLKARPVQVRGRAGRGFRRSRRES